MSSSLEKLQLIVKSLPSEPGVYQYLDDNGRIIYVGKAKDLKKRVSSYFNRDASHSGKLLMLVKRIEDIRVIVVKNELEALLLENSLIKEHQPKYNINLKDDKTYPWICIKKERFPRIFPTRNMIRDGSQYFGPYASVKLMYNLLDLIKRLYPLRTCSLNLSEQAISDRKYKICLEYHIGNCKGPCEDLQSEAEYDEMIQMVKSIIRGQTRQVAATIHSMMMQHADKFEFEQAQLLKDKLLMLEQYQSKSTVVNTSVSNADVFTVVSDEKSGFVNYMKVVDGAVIQAYTVEVRKKLDESDEQILAFSIGEIRIRIQSDSREIILPFDIDLEIPGIVFTVPQKGDKKQLLDMSMNNARYYRLEQMKKAELVDPERRGKRVLEQLMKDLRMKVLPERIECFDNSNLGGDHAVAAMVSFKNCKPDKKEYRHYNIKTVQGPDDFASMEEVIYRRYKRLTEEGKHLPQLIVVDGGKGQLSSAVKSLEKLGLRGKITIIGIAKKLEEIYYPGDSLPMYLDKKSESLKIIQHLRDEAHRFGITHHRKKREKGTIKTELTDIASIGEATANLLLKKFRSVNGIKMASAEELEQVVGKSRSRAIIDYFEKQQKS
ncbi:MAG: excinuclease ABC subunit UvrC [Bacteroidales bacterium]|nr:excinuclease ABC subunit UvrC [Bacteroidales bacterium]